MKKQPAKKEEKKFIGIKNIFSLRPDIKTLFSDINRKITKLKRAKRELTLNDKHLTKEAKQKLNDRIHKKEESIYCILVKIKEYVKDTETKLKEKKASTQLEKKETIITDAKLILDNLEKLYEVFININLKIAKVILHIVKYLSIDLSDNSHSNETEEVKLQKINDDIKYKIKILNIILKSNYTLPFFKGIDKIQKYLIKLFFPFNKLDSMNLKLFIDNINNKNIISKLKNNENTMREYYYDNIVDNLFKLIIYKILFGEPNIGILNILNTLLLNNYNELYYKNPFIMDNLIDSLCIISLKISYKVGGDENKNIFRFQKCISEILLQILNLNKTISDITYKKIICVLFTQENSDFNEMINFIIFNNENSKKNKKKFIENIIELINLEKFIKKINKTLFDYLSFFDSNFENLGCEADNSNALIDKENKNMYRLHFNFDNNLITEYRNNLISFLYEDFILDKFPNFKFSTDSIEKSLKMEKSKNDKNNKNKVNYLSTILGSNISPLSNLNNLSSLIQKNYSNNAIILNDKEKNILIKNFAQEIVPIYTLDNPSYSQLIKQKIYEFLVSEIQEINSEETLNNEDINNLQMIRNILEVVSVSKVEKSQSFRDLIQNIIKKFLNSFTYEWDFILSGDTDFILSGDLAIIILALLTRLVNNDGYLGEKKLLTKVFGAADCIFDPDYLKLKYQILLSNNQNFKIYFYSLFLNMMDNMDSPKTYDITEENFTYLINKMTEYYTNCINAYKEDSDKIDGINIDLVKLNKSSSIRKENNKENIKSQITKLENFILDNISNLLSNLMKKNFDLIKMINCLLTLLIQTENMSFFENLIKIIIKSKAFLKKFFAKILFDKLFESFYYLNNIVKLNIVSNLFIQSIKNDEYITTNLVNKKNLINLVTEISTSLYITPEFKISKSKSNKLYSPNWVINIFNDDPNKKDYKKNSQIAILDHKVIYEFLIISLNSTCSNLKNNNPISNSNLDENVNNIFVFFSEKLKRNFFFFKNLEIDMLLSNINVRFKDILDENDILKDVEDIIKYHFSIYLEILANINYHLDIDTPITIVGPPNNGSNNISNVNKYSLLLGNTDLKIKEVFLLNFCIEAIALLLNKMDNFIFNENTSNENTNQHNNVNNSAGNNLSGIASNIINDNMHSNSEVITANVDHSDKEVVNNKSSSLNDDYKSDTTNTNPQNNTNINSNDKGNMDEIENDFYTYFLCRFINLYSMFIFSLYDYENNTLIKYIIDQIKKNDEKNQTSLNEYNEFITFSDGDIVSSNKKKKSSSAQITEAEKKNNNLQFNINININQDEEDANEDPKNKIYNYINRIINLFFDIRNKICCNTLSIRYSIINFIYLNKEILGMYSNLVTRIIYLLLTLSANSKEELDDIHKLFTLNFPNIIFVRYSECLLQINPPYFYIFCDYVLFYFLSVSGYNDYKIYFNIFNRLLLGNQNTGNKPRYFIILEMLKWNSMCKTKRDNLRLFQDNNKKIDNIKNYIEKNSIISIVNNSQIVILNPIYTISFNEIITNGESININNINPNATFELLNLLNEGKNLDDEKKESLIDSEDQEKDKNKLDSNERFLLESLNKFNISLELNKITDASSIKDLNQYIEQLYLISVYKLYECNVYYFPLYSDLDFDDLNEMELKEYLTFPNNYLSFINSLGKLTKDETNEKYLMKYEDINNRINFLFSNNMKNQFEEIKKLINDKNSYYKKDFKVNNYVKVIWLENIYDDDQEEIKKLKNKNCVFIIIYPYSETHYLIGIKNEFSNENKIRNILNNTFFNEITVYVGKNFEILSNLITKLVVIINNLVNSCLHVENNSFYKYNSLVEIEDYANIDNIYNRYLFIDKAYQKFSARMKFNSINNMKEE